MNLLDPAFGSMAAATGAEERLEKSRPVKQLSEDVMGRVQTMVWSGLYTREQILQDLEGVIEDEGEEVSLDHQHAIVDGLLQEKKEAEDGWPEHTDCDKLDAAFARLELEKIIALQNAGYTQSDGYEDCCEVYQRRGGASCGSIGFCFYQFQDLGRAVRGEPLYLSYGTFKPSDSEAVGVGRTICAVLEGQELTVDWNGRPETRPRILNLDWKRRGP